jgi:NTE family protein
LREFRAIAFVKQLIAEGRIDRDEYRDIRMHRIDADEALKDLTASSKINAEWAFLEYLRDLGRSAAEDWLDENFSAVGKSASFDLSAQVSHGFTLKPEGGVGRKVRKFLETRKKPAAALTKG